MNIADTAVVVTGGASGLGEATARMLAKRGAKVTLLDVNQERGSAIAGDIGGHFVLTNVSDEASMDAALDEAETRHGVARTLVNCAGIAPAVRIVDKHGAPHPLELFRNTVDVNLIGTFNAIAQFAARLIAAKIAGEEVGVIINTASVAAFDGQIGQAAYASSKAGIVGLTLCAARDLAQHRIRVMTIAPGTFQTPMLMALPEAARESLGNQVPHPSRLGRPDEYAQLVESIVDNPMLNGDVVRLDGAIRMASR